MATNGFIAEHFQSAFNIYQLVFGYRAVPFPVGFQPGEMIHEPIDKISKLGTSIFKKNSNDQYGFCPVELQQHRNGAVVNSYTLPFSAISIGMSKNIVETQLIARKGTVKELISINDYVFNVSGVLLTNDVNEYDLPQDQLTKFKELFELNEPLKIINPFVEIFIPGENNVVVYDLNLPDMKGVSGAQAYSFTIKTDNVLELEEI